MTRIPLGLSAFERTEGDLPQTPVINMYAEQAPTEESGVVLQSRPGLTDRAANMGTNIEALFQRDKVLDSALFGVSGGNLYEGTTSLGAVATDGPVFMAGYENFLFVAGGNSLYGYDGTTLAAISFPDSASVAKVVVGASRAICIREDTGKFYWSDALETDIEALDFATAENQPDRLLDMVFLDDILILGGAETIEFWPNTGSSTLPFQPLEGAVIERGVKATGCMVIWDGTFAMVGNDNTVRVGQGQTRISNPGLEAKIAASSSVRLWAFQLDGQEFLALRLDSATYVFGNTNNLWSEFQSYGSTNWLPQAYAGGVFGCSNGKTAEWGSDYVDFGGVLERRCRGGFAINSGGVQITNVQLRLNPGQAPNLTGQYAEPEIELRLSRNAGQTWGPWQARSLGEQGEYRKRVQWRGLGLASRPGFLCEFRQTDPVPLRISEALVNEAYGGR